MDQKKGKKQNISHKWAKQSYDQNSLREERKGCKVLVNKSSLWNGTESLNIKKLPNNLFADVISFTPKFPATQRVLQTRAMETMLIFKRFLHYKFPKIKGMLYIILELRMSQENMWVMVYFLPQFAHFDGYQFDVEPVSAGAKVEEQKVDKNIQSMNSFKQANQDIRHRRSKTEPRHCEKVVEDSSFQIPERQENKMAQQKLGRNSVSNILRLFTKLLKTVMVKQNYEKLRARFNFPVSCKEFNSWINCIGLNTNKYIRIKKVINGIKAKPHLGRIVSIFYSIFEAEYARASILTSSKTESKNVIPTLAQIRKIKQEINLAVQIGFKKTKENESNVFD